MIYVYEPSLGGREREYLLDAFDSTWISSRGKYLDRFEKDFASYTRVDHAIAVSNGTVALHLALHCLGVGAGDEVIVPSFTYIASVNTIVQTGAKPIFAESNSADWLLDIEHVEQLITPRTRAIMAVHLYGAVCDMDALSALAKRHNLLLVEDCAEALGSTYKGQHVGTFGDVSTFSFFGNKTVTTGEGGMVVTNNADLAAKLKIVKGQGQDPSRRYWHSELGFNYRMTNLAASIGVAQLERIDEILARKREIGARYRRRLAEGNVTFQDVQASVSSSDWLISFLLPAGMDRDAIMSALEASGIETRPVFYCAHRMPPHYKGELGLKTAEDIASRGLSVPSSPVLTDEQVDFICEKILQVVGLK